MPWAIGITGMTVTNLMGYRAQMIVLGLELNSLPNHCSNIKSAAGLIGQITVLFVVFPTRHRMFSVDTG